MAARTGAVIKSCPPSAVCYELLTGPTYLRSTYGLAPDVAAQVQALRSGGSQAYASAWRENEEALRDFARREHVRFPHGAELFYAEGLALRA